MDQLEGKLIGTGSPAVASLHEIRTGAARREAANGSRSHVVDLKKIEFPVPSKERLARAFNLSPAEIRLAQHLARGESLEEIAPRVGVKLSTARSQLASIFTKTGVKRQPKLVAVLSRLAHLGH
jgi:DNA-binding CsgD family transcriptional regulator